MNAQSLDINNLPTPKDEAWKYTNLPRAVPDGLGRENVPQELIIHKTRGQICEQSEEIVFTGRDNTLHRPVLKIVLEDGAQATIIERHEGQGAYWRNMAVDIELGKNAHLHHYRLFQDDERAVATINTQITQEQDSSYHGFYVLERAGLVRNELTGILAGKGAHADFAGVNLLKNKQHGDTTILIEHQAPHCTSSQFFRHVLANQSRGVFQGKVHVHQIAQKTDGYQLSNALLLSDKAEMDTKPELEIYADDVKCSHGTTTGQLDDSALFYLRARGIPEAQARRLLVQAFVDESVDKIEDESFRARVHGLCQQWLTGVL